MKAQLLNPDEFAKFQKVCGLLESDSEGERANAAALGTRMLKSRGLCWADVIRFPVPAQNRPPPPPPPDDWRRIIADLLLRPSELNAWEERFLTDCFAYRTLSPKQHRCLVRIYDKVLGGGR